MTPASLSRPVHADNRLDRLLLVLVNTYFPYYDRYTSTVPSVDPRADWHMFNGLWLWERDAILPTAVDSLTAHDIRQFRPSAAYLVLEPYRPSADKEESATSSRRVRREYTCGYQHGKKTPFCTCDYWRNTGKTCQHLWAVTAYRTNGPVLQFSNNALAVRQWIAQQRTRKFTRIIDGVYEHCNIDSRYAIEDEEEFWGGDLDPRRFFDPHDPTQAATIGGLDAAHPARPRADTKRAVDTDHPFEFEEGDEEMPSEDVPFGRWDPPKAAFAPPAALVEDVRRSRDPEIDPIGRRYQDIALPHSEGSSGRSLSGPSPLMGRPKNQVPFRKDRSAHGTETLLSTARPHAGSNRRPQLSSLRSGPKEKKARGTLVPQTKHGKRLSTDQPAGAVNPDGFSCFANALFQIVCRMDQWLAGRNVDSQPEAVIGLLNVVADFKAQMNGERPIKVEGGLLSRLKGPSGTAS